MVRGAQCFTVRDFMSDADQVFETLKKIKKIGYACVQAGAPHFMTDADMQTALTDAGLYTCTAYGSYEKMLADPAEIEDTAERAAVYKTDLVGIGTLPADQRESEDGYKRFAEGMNKIAAGLKKGGCKLIYHPHALEFFSLGGGRHGMEILLNETDPEGVMFSLDTHWLASGGVCPVKWIHKAKGRMPMIHFKDYAIVGGGETIETVKKVFAEVGEGNIDWPLVVKACRDTGVQTAVVEQDVCKGDPFDSLAISYKNMEKFKV
ncbi:MAG: sugar phosphate isomerase/epimerase [Defluviitaleaceae bacterium]|nr:sugar phosphate isomerase/epimerase [Defluviitaleaceae bacterium]